MKKTSIILICILMLGASVPAAAAEEDKKGSTTLLEDVLKIDGQVRLRFEGWENRAPGRDLTQTLSRTRVGFLAKPDTHINVYVQFQDSRVWGEEPSTLASTDNVDLHQAWFAYSFKDAPGLTIKAGRQELAYGDQRLIGSVGWSNVGRSFDAVKLIWKGEELQVDGFLAQTHESFSAAEDSFFGGLYAQISAVKHADIDVYGLLKKDDRLIFTGEIDRTPGELTVWTLGARLAGKLSGSMLQYAAEGAFQRGDYGMESLEAWAVHVRASFALGTDANLSIHGEFNYASGDEDPADGTIGTFDNLFPTNHNKYGYVDFIGWRNLFHLQGGVSASPFKGHTFTALFHSFSLAEESDNAYRASGAPLLVVPAGNTEDQIGTELDLTWNVTEWKPLTLLAGYSRFFAGDLFTSIRGETEDTDFFYVMTSVSF